LQPLPILPQYFPPGGAQVTDGVQAASLPASTVMTMVPAAPAVPVVPLDPPAPAAPLMPAEAPAPVGIGLTFATQPSEAVSAAPRT
jgi:hypothetical protein